MNKQMSGSMTVEMSMLFPLIIIVISSMLLFAFYMNDIVCVRASAQEYGIIANTSDKSKEDLENEFYDSIKRETIVADIKNVKVNKSSNNVKITTVLSFGLPVFSISRIDEISVIMHEKSNKDYIVYAKVAIDTISRLKKR